MQPEQQLQYMKSHQTTKSNLPFQNTGPDKKETRASQQLISQVSSSLCPKSFWKQNLYLNFYKREPNFVSVQQLQDPIQTFLLKEHRVVILQEVIKLRKEIENYQSWDDFSQSNWDKISRQQFAIFFLEQLIQDSIFTYEQSIDFKALLQKRKDWKKLFQQLFQHIDRKLYWQMAYLFYSAIKLLIKIQTIVKLTWQELENSLDKYLEDNLMYLKNKLISTGIIQNVQSHYKKILLTVIFLINGIFVNKFYNPNQQLHELKFLKNRQRFSNAVLSKNKSQISKYFNLKKNFASKKQKTSTNSF